MKKLLVGLLVLGSFSSFASGKILECEARATMKGKVLFEISTDVYDRRVNSQGSTISDYTQRNAVITKLTVTSNDKFKDNFSVSISHRVGDKVIEKNSLKDLSLSSGTNFYGISKDLFDYSMDLSCRRI